MQDKPSNPSASNNSALFFNSSGIIADQKAKIALLNTQLAKLKSSPQIVLRAKIEKMILAGKIGTANQLCHVAARIDRNTYESLDHIMVDTKLNQLFPVKEEDFQFFVTPESLPADEERKIWAEYYKAQAVDNCKNNKILRGLRLFEEALTYDATIMDSLVSLDDFLANTEFGFARIWPSEIKVAIGKILRGTCTKSSHSISDFTEEEFVKFLKEKEVFDYATVKTYRTPWVIVATKGSAYQKEFTEKSDLCLMLAALGYHNIFRWLISKADDKTFLLPEYCKRYIHFASRFNQLPMLEYFVNDLKLDVNYPNDTEFVSKIVRGLMMNGCGFYPSVVELYSELTCSALMNSVRNNNLKMMNFLLTNGALVDAEDCLGVTPLMLAAQQNSVLSLERLLECKPDLNKRDHEGLSALLHACMKGNDIIVEKLLKVGARLEATGEDQCSRQIPPLIAASVSGNLKLITLLLAAGAQFSRQGEETVCAAENGHYDLLKYLIVEMRRPLSKDGDELIEACRYGFTSIVQLLIDNGVNPRAIDSSDGTALYIAIKAGHEEIVKLLLAQDGVLAFSEDSDYFLPLQLASFHNHSNIVQLLLNHGCAVDGDKDNTARPLVLASREGNLDVVRILVENGATINEENCRSDALILAAENGHLAIVKLLLEKGAMIDGQAKYAKETALIRALKHREFEVAMLLLEHNANVNLGSSYESPMTVALHQRKPEIIKALLKRGATITDQQLDDYNKHAKFYHEEQLQNLTENTNQVEDGQLQFRK